MHLKPGSISELQAALTACAERKEWVEAVDLSALCRVAEHFPEDMTATVEAGLTVAALQEVVGLKGQWLPVDPPLPEHVTVRELLDQSLSGPRRCGYGLVRDYVIGIKVALANGEVIKSGGKVVKNVAGYDLAKVFIGAKGSLGVIVEATFKLRPKPEAQAFLTATFTDIAQVETVRSAVLNSSLMPVVFDLRCNSADAFQLVLAFDGAAEDVEQQAKIANGLGFSEGLPTNYWNEFWMPEGEAPAKWSVLPSRVVETIGRIVNAAPSPYPAPPKGTRGPECDLVAHLANGVIYYRGGPPPPVEMTPLELMKRTKEIFDPNGIFPQYA